MELQRQGQLVDAEAAYRKAIAFKPNYARAHCNLGYIPKTKGQFRDALAAYERGHELGSQSHGWQYPSAQWLRECQRLVELDAKLSKVLSGDKKPIDANEQAELAGLCQQPCKKLYVAAARFYTDAFAAEPKRADDLRTRVRYNAACAAALAGCGQGNDAAQLDAEERTRLRRQALTWLRADLTTWGQILEKQADQARPTVLKTMQHWQQDSDFAGVRGDALAKLPEAERKAWLKLWKEVEMLRERAEEVD